MKGMRLRSSEGFTLIEMLIVIAVISILAGIVLVGVTGFQSSARDTKRIGDLRSIQNSLELYYTRCGHYPMQASGCGIGSEGEISWDNLASSLEAVGVISDVVKLPIDPKASNEQYQYATSDGGFSYTLKATLENRSSSLDDRGVEIDSDPNLDCGDDDNYYCIGSS